VKRIIKQFEIIVSWKNLLQSYYAAKKGAKKGSNTCRFNYHLEKELIQLQQELIAGTYYPGPYHIFRIYDPKERTIACAPFKDRVVHHAIVDVLTPFYEKSFIHDSYASRPNKGTYNAIERAQSFLRKTRYYLKMDIEKYFDRIQHNILLQILDRKIKDPPLMDVIERIIESSPSKVGVPIGNLTSQFFANVYLDQLDHVIKDRWHIKCYIRYMDDFVAFAQEKDELHELKDRIQLYLNTYLNLTLKPTVTCIHKNSHGLNFLGMRIYPGYIRMKRENRRRSLKKAYQKMTLYEKNVITEDQMIQSMDSILSHLKRFCPNINIWVPEP